MVGAGQVTVIIAPVEAGKAPGPGVQASPVAPISRERMQGAVHVDGQDRW